MTDEFTSNNNITYYTSRETTNGANQISNPGMPVENFQPSYSLKPVTHNGASPLSFPPPAHHAHSSNSVVQHSTVIATPSNESITLQQVASLLETYSQQMQTLRTSLEAKIGNLDTKLETNSQRLENQIETNSQQIQTLRTELIANSQRLEDQIETKIGNLDIKLENNMRQLKSELIDTFEAKFESTDHQNKTLDPDINSNDGPLKPSNTASFADKIDTITQPQIETQTEVNPVLNNQNSNTSDITGNTTDNRDDDQMDIDERIMPEREHNETEPLIQGMTTAIALGCNTDSNWRNPREKPTMKNEAYAKKTKPKKKLKKRNRAYKIRIKSLRKIKRENVNVNIIYPKNMKKRALLYSPKCQPHTPSCFLSPPVPP